MPSLRALDRTGNVIQIDSFSKTAFPGLRVGWCIGPESVIERLRLVKQSTDLHTDQLSQATMAEFMRRGYLTRHLVKMNKVYRSRLEAMEAALEKHMPEEARGRARKAACRVWVSLPAGFDAGELLIHARERGVMFAAGAVLLFTASAAEYAAAGFSGRGRKTDRAGHSDAWRIAEDRSFASGSAARAANCRRAWRWSKRADPMQLEDATRIRRIFVLAAAARIARGMQLTFEQDDAAQRIRGQFRLGAEYQGGPGFVHGGIIATLLDEVMGKVSRFREVITR